MSDVEYKTLYDCGEPQAPEEKAISSSARRNFLKVAGGSLVAAALPALASPLAQYPPAAAPSSLGAAFHSPLGQVQPRTLSAEGVTFEYFDFGNPRGVPLVLVHGFPDSPLAWESVVNHLDLSQVRIIAPYLRGYGRSTVQRNELLSGQFAALGSDLLVLLEALNIRTFHLAGHDWGARTSYAASVLAPDRVLTLTALASPYLAWKGELLPPAQVHGYWYQLYFQVDAARTMLSEHRADFCKELWKVWSPAYHFSDATFAAAAAAWDNPQFVPIVLNYYRIRWGDASGKPAYSNLEARLDVKPPPQIAVPTVFIQGDADACDLLHGADGQEKAFSSSYKRVVLQNVGHFPHRENPPAVAAAISDQIRSKAA